MDKNKALMVAVGIMAAVVIVFGIESALKSMERVQKPAKLETAPAPAIQPAAEARDAGEAPNAEYEYNSKTGTKQFLR